MRSIIYNITQEYAGMRIDHFLRTHKGISYRVVKALKQHPTGILLKGQHARTIDILAAGDVLEITLPASPKNTRLSDLTVEILYEDADILVYNKPPNMPCHQSGGHYNDTLANVYAAYTQQQGGQTVFRPINRLDKDTSGAVVVAKNQIAAGIIWKKVEKTYIALVEGNLPKDHDIVNQPIDRAQPLEMLRVVTPDGQQAITEYWVEKRFAGYTLARFTLHTGRTHQIRVHMAHLGHPLAGDTMYGGGTNLMQRQALHCGEVRFAHPITGVAVNIQAKMYNDMKNALKSIEKT